MTDLIDTDTVPADLNEAKYSAEQLRQMLAKGQAVKNDNGEPSYPIADEEDLRKAIRAVGRGGTSHNKIRAHIIKRAKALGKSDMLPDNWGSSGQMKETATLTESQTLSEAKPVPGVKGRFRVALIRAGWGSSGYYPDEVLERDGPRIWPAGTQQYLNHPTVTEQQELPERRVQDWASEIVTDPVWDPVNRELVAEVQVFPQWQELLNPVFAPKVGLSIRACGEAENGEAEGREGPIIRRLTEGISVDWVTRAGAGGRVLELIESARNTPTSSVAEEQHPPAPPAMPKKKEEAPVSETITPQGAPPSGGAQTTEVSEAAQLRTELAETKQKLAEAELEIAKFGENQRELEDTKAKLAEAERTNLRLQANNAARDKALKTLDESTLPKVAHARVIEAVTGDNVPLNDEGSLDEAALVKNIKAAIEDQRNYLSAFAEESGMGQVTGLGGGSEPQVDVVSELGAVYESIGMSKNAAQFAAKGRG